ncbi:MAG TPA: hypothetical protein DHM37_08890, partial [Candidatus Cloacimonas sp.]|nr:hypothetical protein [Candidatus Cloacimonas sp.]
MGVRVSPSAPSNHQRLQSQQIAAFFYVQNLKRIQGGQDKKKGPADSGQPLDFIGAPGRIRT